MNISRYLYKTSQKPFNGIKRRGGKQRKYISEISMGQGERTTKNGIVKCIEKIVVNKKPFNKPR